MEIKACVKYLNDLYPNQWSQKKFLNWAVNKAMENDFPQLLVKPSDKFTRGTMKALLLKTISVFVYDKSTLLIRQGTEITIDPEQNIAVYKGYHFDIDKSEYSIIN